MNKSYDVYMCRPSVSDIVNKLTGWPLSNIRSKEFEDSCIDIFNAGYKIEITVDWGLGVVSSVEILKK